MNTSLGNLDLTKKPVDIELFLAKPNYEIIAKLKHSFNISNSLKLGGINEISFNVPYEVNIRKEWVKNPHIDKIKDRYLIKAKVGNFEEWYQIRRINKSMDNDKDIININAYLLPYQLGDTLIRSYESTSYNASKVLSDALSSTAWSVGYVDAEFDLKFRSFKVDSQTALDFVIQIADTFNALIIWDTYNKKVNLYNPNNIGSNRGLTIRYGKYLDSIDRESNSDEMVTRFHAYGRDGISIRTQNPTGTTYLDDFSFFMYPFQRDSTRNVLNSSDYMSDGLCHAILDYNDKLETKKTEFANLLSQKNEKEGILTIKENEIDTLGEQLSVIQDIIDVQQSQGTVTNHVFVYNGSTILKSASLNSNYKYVAMAKVSDTTVSVKLDGLSITMGGNNIWTVLGKLTTKSSSSVEISGITTNVNVQILYVKISDAEYTTLSNESALIEKYSVDNKQMQINSKQSEINTVLSEIEGIDNQIMTLRNDIAVENNFTAEQIRERSQFIIEREWTDGNYISEKDLYEEAIKRFEELKKPKTVIKIDIVNFLQIVEAQRDWDKLNLGDTITISYDKLNINVQAKLIEIDFDYEDEQVNLTIANVKDLESDEEKLVKMLYKSVSTSTTLSMKEYKWDGVEHAQNQITQIIENTWDATKRGIDAGTNESVSISRRGIIIKDTNDPLKYLVAQHGVLALTNDGGNTWKHAITPDGIVAERLFGKLIVGNKLIIGDENGTFEIKGDLLTVKDNNNAVRTQLGQYATGKYGLLLRNKAGTQTVLDEDGIMQSWQEGEEDNVDSTNPIVLDLYVPPEATSISKGILRFRLKPFRAYSKGASSGGGSTVTSSSGGGALTTSTNGTWYLRSYLLPGDFMNSGGSHSHSISTDTAPNHNHGIAGGTKLAVDGGGSVIWSESGSHSHGGSTTTDGSHVHSMYSVAHDHDLSIPDHSHSVSVPSHTHGIVYGIYNSTSATNVKVVINGTDRTVDLGGGTTGFTIDQSSLNIAPYLTTGWNTISLSSSQLGRISSRVFLQCFVTI
jgi:phage minor structural protein